MRLHIPEGQPQPREVRAVPRPSSLEGLRIGLLDNTKAPVDKMLAHLDRRLHERIPGVQTVHYAKREMGIPAPEALLTQLQQVDVVINALGDWGSCSSWSLHDSVELEKRGIPTVLLQTPPFVSMIRNQAKALGMPNLPGVVLPHPIGGIPIEAVYAKVDAAVDDIINTLTSPLPQTEAAETTGATGATGARLLELDTTDEFHGVLKEFMRRGWGDGLPLVPPTEERVAAMVAGAGLPANHLAGVITPRMGMATVERIAVNAVMAGCLPQHMPVLVAAVGALVDPKLSLKNMQVSTHPVTPLLIVGGPLAQALDIHGGTGAFGPGPWSNGVIGRAIRLILINIGGARPGEISKATMSHPGRYTYCIAENEAALPAGWPSLRAERGFAPEVSTVTVIGGEAPHNINDHESTTAGGIVTMIAGTMATTGQNNGYYEGEVLLLLGPEHAATIAAEGWTKDDIRHALYEQARIPMSRYSRENIERRLWRYLVKRYKDRPLDTPVSMVQKWQDITVLVAGGPGKHSMYIPTNGKSYSVTRPIVKADGSPWLPGDLA